MPSITIREYNGSSGALLGNVSVLSFGRISAGTTSATKVIDIDFSEVPVVGNIKLAVISSGGLTVNSNPTSIAADGSSASGYFGVESSIVFDSTKAAGPLSRHFAGINSTITAGNSNNVSIPNRSDTVSAYIYLSIQASTSVLNTANGSFKVFFDYS